MKILVVFADNQIYWNEALDIGGVFLHNFSILEWSPMMESAENIKAVRMTLERQKEEERAYECMSKRERERYFERRT